jgi:hypothetical protein
MSEIWKAIPGFEGLYEASSEGRVRSLDRRSGGRLLRGRILRQSVSNGGYRVLQLCRGGERTTMRAHHLVAITFLGPPEAGFEVCHNDGNPGNNDLGNLRWGSRSDNARDTVRHGKHRNTAKTHCPKGHAYDESNTLTSSRGWRYCRSCHRALTRDSRGHAIKWVTG